jgi:hypothetical protein
MSSSWIAPNHLSDSSSLPKSAGTHAKDFIDAACEIDRRTSPEASKDASPGSQARAVEAWARASGTLISDAEIDVLSVVSNSTSEHEVFFRFWDGRAIKRTRAGVYGQIPIPLNGKIDRKNAKPSEYLRRMALQILFIDSELKLEGVTISPDKPSIVLFEPPGQPSFVISQRFFEKTDAVTTEEIKELMEDSGFQFDPKAYFGWFRREDRLIVVDAKPDNFIKTAAGLIPIDLQMAQFTPEEMKTAGLV